MTGVKYFGHQIGKIYNFWRNFTVTLAVESLNRPICSPDAVRECSSGDDGLEISWVVSICFRFIRIIFIENVKLIFKMQTISIEKTKKFVRVRIFEPSASQHLCNANNQ